MLAVDTKVNTDYIASSCWGLTFYLFLEKVLTLVLSFLLSERWTQPLWSPNSPDLSPVSYKICAVLWSAGSQPETPKCVQVTTAYHWGTWMPGPHSQSVASTSSFLCGCERRILQTYVMMCQSNSIFLAACQIIMIQMMWFLKAFLLQLLQIRIFFPMVLRECA